MHREPFASLSALREAVWYPDSDSYGSRYTTTSDNVCMKGWSNLGRRFTR